MRVGPGSRWAVGAIFAGLLLAGRPVSASEVHAALGMAYDSNLFESPAGPQSGWVSRFSVTSSGYLLRRHKGYIHLQHQGGIKRLWEAERKTLGGAGDVVANSLALAGAVQAAPRVTLGVDADLKLKTVNRVSGEEGYLRGNASGRVSGDIGKRFVGRLFWRTGGDDSRDSTLSEVVLNEVGVEVQCGRSRQLRGRFGLNLRWLDYDRPALRPDSGAIVAPQAFLQSDRMRELQAGIEVYRGMLVTLTYGFLSNRSNSFGYGFRAHRLQALLSRHLFCGVDGQAYVNVQFRRYGDSLPPLPGGGAEADEYEQSTAVLKLSRQVGDRYGVSVQYGFYRNGARRSGGFFRKHVATVSLETSL